MNHEESDSVNSHTVLTGAREGTPVLVSLRVNHGDPNEMVPWLAFPALSPCEADHVWVLVHIL